MEPDEKEYLKRSLDELAYRLQEIQSRSLQYDIQWQRISSTLDEAKEAFDAYVGAWIEQCRLLGDQVGTTHRSFSLFRGIVDHLWTSSDVFRKVFLRIFPHEFPSRLYANLFIHGLIESLPASIVPSSGIKFIVVPTGEVASWPLHTILGGPSSAMLGDSARDRAAKAAQTQIYAFECDPEEPIQRLVIQGHEIFHMAMRMSGEAENGIDVGALHDMVGDGELTEYFERAATDVPDLEPEAHLTEFLCDFAAAAHYGPAFGRAFIQEIAFSDEYASPTHPNRAARAYVILSAYNGSRHPYVADVRQYMSAHETELGAVTKTSLKPMVTKLRKILQEHGVKRYDPPDLFEKVKTHIEHNVPLIVDDVRDMINSLPGRRALSPRAQRYYDEFVRASIRKNSMWQTFNRKMREMGLGTLEAYDFTPTAFRP